MLSVLRRAYLLSAVNELTNSPKILIPSQGSLNMKRRCLSDLNSVLASLPSYLSEGPLKWEFLDAYLTTSFGVRKFKNKSTMGVIFFWKC